jgi:hypothetical protein
MTAPRTDMQEDLLGRLRAWRRHNIRIGLAGWSPGAWEGLLECEPNGSIDSYARIFPTALLRLGNAPLAPQSATLQRLPEDFGWTVECDHEMMIYRFSYRHPDRNKRGERNAEFLDPERVAAFAGLLQRTLGERLQMMIFRIAPIYRTEELRSADFLAMLNRCLDALPPSGGYAVQIGNPEFVVPDVLDSLGSRNIAYVPPAGGLLEMVPVPGMITAHTAVAYSDALCAGREEEGGMAFHALVRRCLEEKRSACVYLYDGADRPGPAVGRGEGPVRLARLLAGLDNELARRSPIKRQAA